MNPFPKGQFGLIYLDPAWKHEMYSEKGKGKSPDRHYDCMTLEEMMALRDQIIFATAPNSVMVMWTTWSAGNVNGKVVDFLADAMFLMRHYGFQRVTGGPWIKRAGTGNPNMGMGKSFRQSSELFIVGTHGSPRIKNHSTRNVLTTGDYPKTLEEIDSFMVDTMIREHSRKPDEMYENLENLFEGPFLELNARTTREGWSSWGNQIDHFPETK